MRSRENGVATRRMLDDSLSGECHGQALVRVSRACHPQRASQIGLEAYSMSAALRHWCAARARVLLAACLPFWACGAPAACLPWLVACSSPPSPRGERHDLLVALIQAGVRCKRAFCLQRAVRSGPVARLVRAFLPGGAVTVAISSSTLLVPRPACRRAPKQVPQ